MAKVYLICGKICSGKSYYSKKLKEKTNSVIISPDEATYDLLNNQQGEFYDEFSKRLIKYFDKKCVEIVKANANVVYERGLWTKEERESVRKFFRDNNIETELHYIHISDDNWYKQIKERNKKIESGIDKEDFYLDDGLLNKIISLFEEPSLDEVDVYYENNYMSKN